MNLTQCTNLHFASVGWSSNYYRRCFTYHFDSLCIWNYGSLYLLLPSRFLFLNPTGHLRLVMHPTCVSKLTTKHTIVIWSSRCHVPFFVLFWFVFSLLPSCVGLVCVFVLPFLFFTVLLLFFLFFALPIVVRLSTKKLWRRLFLHAKKCPLLRCCLFFACLRALLLIECAGLIFMLGNLLRNI